MVETQTDLGTTAHRNRQFDVLRIVFASLVLLAHAPELTDGDRSRELLTRLTHTDLTLGNVAVDGFFLLSGMLIVQSWEHDPNLLRFLRKRLLRIVPGCLVATVVSVLVVGLLAPGVPDYFHSFHLPWTSGRPFVRPPVLPGMPDPYINGSLWTIPYELRCYVLVALFGLCGWVRRRAVWLGATLLLLLIFCSPWLTAVLSWQGLDGVVGEPSRVFRLTSTFLVGGSLYLFRRQVPVRPVLAILSAVLLTALLFVARAAEPALDVLGGYLLFYLGSLRLAWLDRWPKFPDISYGIYLYGWPVESLWIFYRHGSPWLTVLVALPLCVGLGWLSWHLVESPMLKLKPKTPRRSRAVSHA